MRTTPPPAAPEVCPSCGKGCFKCYEIGYVTGATALRAQAVNAILQQLAEAIAALPVEPRREAE